MEAATVPTPLGPLSLLTVEEGILASGLTDRPETLLAELPAPRRTEPLRVLDTAPASYASGLQAYFDGQLDAIDALPVVQTGSAFRLAAWREMRRVAPGTTISYRELAAAAGKPGAARAAGASCASNLVPVIVPCHRVRRADGNLGGYYYGLHIKRWLLAHERGERGLLPPAAPPAPGSSR
ncbi:cysteine methyltransferase [Streptomyces griseocarneus]|nr:cysteine methyltransferase [Streptomyces griseocarneus]